MQMISWLWKVWDTLVERNQEYCGSLVISDADKALQDCTWSLVGEDFKWLILITGSVFTQVFM